MQQTAHSSETTTPGAHLVLRAGEDDIGRVDLVAEHVGVPLRARHGVARRREVEKHSFTESCCALVEQLHIDVHRARVVDRVVGPRLASRREEREIDTEW